MKLTKEQLTLIENEADASDDFNDDGYLLEGVGKLTQIVSERGINIYEYVIKVDLPNGEVTHVAYSRYYDSYNGTDGIEYPPHEVEQKEVTRTEWVPSK